MPRSLKDEKAGKDKNLVWSSTIIAYAFRITSEPANHSHTKELITQHASGC